MLTTRDPDITALLDSHKAVVATMCDNPVVDFFKRGYEALETPGNVNPNPGTVQLPVCNHIPAALNATAAASPELTRLSETLGKLTPRLGWRKRDGIRAEDPNFPDGHANAVVIGVDGLELHGDVRLGASLVAPGVTYPDHRHPPEEGYLVMSGGSWRQDHGEWFRREPGETVHNVPNIWHAMKANSDTPLVALWMLWVGN